MSSRKKEMKISSDTRKTFCRKWGGGGGGGGGGAADVLNNDSIAAVKEKVQIL